MSYRNQIEIHLKVILRAFRSLYSFLNYSKINLFYRRNKSASFLLSVLVDNPYCHELRSFQHIRAHLRQINCPDHIGVERTWAYHKRFYKQTSFHQHQPLQSLGSLGSLGLCNVWHQDISTPKAREKFVKDVSALLVGVSWLLSAIKEYDTTALVKSVSFCYLQTNGRHCVT